MLVLALLCGGGFALYLTVACDATISKTNSVCSVGFINTLVVNKLIPSTAVMVSLLNVMLPTIFGMITKMEKPFYLNPSSADIVLLARSFIMKITSVYVVLVGFFLSGDLASTEKVVRVEGVGKQMFAPCEKTPRMNRAGSTW